MQTNGQQKTAVVGLSGGVDSTVSALLLQQQGYRVIGLFMKNWEEQDDGICHSAIDYEDVVHVCEQMEIPCYQVNFTKQYWDHVFEEFLQELKKGNTPNPDILCNREIKFKALFQKALDLGADYLATGHYCQVGEKGELLRGTDPNKDQTYFLYAVDGKCLSRVLFPIGHLTKPQVRKIAQEYRLCTAKKKDSTGICFIGKRNFKSFLKPYLGYSPGNFENLKGDVLGQHDGVAFYTIGQRKGLGIGGSGEAWYVIEKDLKRNVVIIEQGANHPALFRNTLFAKDLNWISENPTFPRSCTAKIRYRHQDEPCMISSCEDPNTIKVVFKSPQRAITLGQSVVFYDGNHCLGGGIISCL